MQPDQSGQSAKPGVGAFVALGILSGTVGLNTVDRNMFGLLLPMIQKDIAISDTGLGFLMGPAFVVVYSIAGVPIAWLADKAGRKSIIAAGLALWSAVTAMTGLASTMAHLFAARIMLGIGEASNMAPSSALIGDLFPQRYRVMAMAVFAAGGPVAIMIFYPTIGWIAQNHGWRYAYPLMGTIGLLVAVLTMAFVREPGRDRVAAADASGGDDTLTFRAAASSVLRSGRFLLLCAGGVAVSINYSALLAWFPTFMERVHGLDAQQVGAMLGMYKGLLGVAATIGGGLLVTWLMRFDARWLAWAPLICVLGMVPAQFMLLLAATPLAWHLGLALDTILMSIVTPCLFALLITLLEPRIRATGTALYLLIFNLIGQSVGPVIVGALNDGPLIGLGSAAIRYSLLAAPAAMGLGALFLYGLSIAMARVQAGSAVS